MKCVQQNIAVPKLAVAGPAVAELAVVEPHAQVLHF
jgi:hypothetical protein